MRNFLRSLFGSKKSISKIKTRMQSRRLELLGLEERIVPATITNVAGVITFTLDANNNETLSNLSTLVNGAVININAGSNIGLTGSGLPAGVTIEGSVANQQFVKVDTAVFNTFAGIEVLGQAGRSDSVTISATGIDLSAAPGGSNQSVLITLNQDGQSTNDTLNVNGLIKSKGTGAVNLNAASGSMTIAGAGDITTTGGNVTLNANSFSTSGDITTGSGNISFGSALNLGGNIAINSTSGNLSMGIVTAGGKNLIINEGSGSVSIGSLNITTGELRITTSNTGTGANPAIKLATAVFGTPGIVTAGIINLSAAGDIRVGDHANGSGVVNSASVNAKSTAGDVIFDNTVTTSSVGGFTSEASDASKATKIANAVTVGAGANALITGNLVTNSASAAAIAVTGTATINITGKVDAATANNNLALTSVNGAITIGGAVGSSTTAMGILRANGNTSFTANGAVTAKTLLIGDTAAFATSINFAEAVKVTGVSGFGANYSADINTTGTGTINFAKTLEATTGAGPISFQTQNGNTTVSGNITSKEGVEITSSGSGNISVAGITTDNATGAIKLETGTGNITTSGVISTSGATANIDIDTITSGDIVIGGNVSASGGGNILLGAEFSQQTFSASGTGNMTINGTVSTTSGDIVIGSGGTGTVSVNKALTTTAVNGDVVIIATGAQTNAINFSKDATITSADEVIFQIDNPTNTISFASGANISAVDGITDGGTGSGNLTLANNLTASNTINIQHVAINLTGAVSMKTSGASKNILIGNINGAQSLTLEATGNITARNTTVIGGSTPLASLTVVNANDTIFRDLSVAKLTLADTTTDILFGGNTVISDSLTTTTEGYNVRFINGKTAVISGAPVFLNTGNVIMQGTTSLPGGATITGGPSTEANLAGTIVSGGAFNIGSGISVIDISNNTQLILNSTTAGSTFASPISLSTIASAAAFKLLGVGTLTLSADSTAGVTTNDSIEVINGTLNVTGKFGSASTTTGINGTITGAGGTIGNLTVSTGTVAPGGTLKTADVSFNAATNYSAAILSKTTASNLEIGSSNSVNLNGATLALSSVASGLSVGNSFTIINNTNTTATTGTFAGLPEGSSVSAKDASGNTVAFTISYKGGTGANDVTLTVASVTPSQTATPQPMVAGQPALNKFTAFGADAGGGPLVTITFANGTYTSFFAYDPAFRGGVRVALGDVNGDGQTDVITGAGPGGGPQVNVYSVNTLSGVVSLQSSFYAFNTSTFTGGVYVAAGHTNSDSFDDVIVSAGAGGGPRVQVYAGSASGVVSSSTLNDFFAYATEFTGGVVVAAGDRTGAGVDEVITAPASNGGWNIKSFNTNGTGNSPTVVEDFFLLNNTTAVGGLSLAVGYLNSGRVADLIIGTTNGGYRVIVDSDTSGIAGVPFANFTGAIRAGVAEDSTGQDYAVALAGPTGGPAVSVYSLGATRAQTDTLFVMNPAFTGGLFGTPTLADNVI